MDSWEVSAIKKHTPHNYLLRKAKFLFLLRSSIYVLSPVFIAITTLLRFPFHFATLNLELIARFLNITFALLSSAK